MNNFSEKVAFIWSVADLLRGNYKPSEYGKVILPLTILRRLDCVLEPTREKVRATAESSAAMPPAMQDRLLLKASGEPFYNTSGLHFAKLLDDQGHIAANLRSYINGFSQNARDIIEYFRFEAQIERLEQANLLYLILKRFNAIALHPKAVSNLEMGYIFEELIRKFSEQSNETAGEHFTPREVIRLMVDLLFSEDDDVLNRAGIVRTMYDPACGTGGMLSVAQEYLGHLNEDAILQVFGQELNDESYAICKADMMLKGQDPENIKRGNSFSEDGLAEMRFDYCISNPPFGVDWKKVQTVIEDEHEHKGFSGRFGAGLPRINDGSLLFLQHMIAKMKAPSDGGSRVAVVFNGSPLFTGAAGSGESEIRRWIIENDWLEAIVALPDQLFYNTGISTYVWLLSNHKRPKRQGKIQLINGVGFFQKMRKSLGNKRNELSPGHIEELANLYHDFTEGKYVKIFNNEDFGFHRITVERPLRLNVQASPDRLERLADESAWKGLVKSKKKDPEAVAADVAEGEATQQAIFAVLRQLDPSRLYKCRDAFIKDLKAAAKPAIGTIPAPILKAIVNALSEQDETAEICYDSKGHPEPDPDLRDYENVPLTEDIDAYMAREVLPHVPDAWVDHSKTKVGYEIPFTRHFYEYTPPRPLAVIEAEIRELESEIQGLLAEALG